MLLNFILLKELIRFQAFFSSFKYINLLFIKNSNYFSKKFNYIKYLNFFNLIAIFYFI